MEDYDIVTLSNCVSKVQDIALYSNNSNNAYAFFDNSGSNYTVEETIGHLLETTQKLITDFDKLKKGYFRGTELLNERTFQNA